jgi:hypothetical protein
MNLAKRNLAKRSIPVACALLLTGPLAVGTVHASSFASTDASMAIGNLRFTLDDPTATLVWNDYWYGEVGVRAQDTDSGFDDDSAVYTYVDDEGDLAAQADTAHVHSLASQMVADGEFVAINPDAAVEATTSSALALAGKDKQASGFAFSNFDNFFFVTDGQAGDPTVQVTIELDYLADLTGIADAQGFFYGFTGAFIELYDVDELSGQVSFPELAYDEVWDEASGTNTNYSNNFGGTLRIVYDIPYNDLHWLYAEADSEVAGSVPVVGTLPLLLLGAGAGFLARRRLRSTTSQSRTRNGKSAVCRLLARHFLRFVMD